MTVEQCVNNGVECVNYKLQLTMCQYAFLEQGLPHARRLGSCVHNGRQIHQPVH